MSDPCTPILQFGTSRFLQAHAALFMSEARVPRSITVVQSSGDPARSGRLAALAAPEGYAVAQRWFADTWNDALAAFARHLEQQK